MKTKYKYINFVQMTQKPGRKTSTWVCQNNDSGSGLGVVMWYAPWRQYCFYPASGSVFNVGCMTDIQHFIGQLMDARK